MSLLRDKPYIMPHMREALVNARITAASTIQNGLDGLVQIWTMEAPGPHRKRIRLIHIPEGLLLIGDPFDEPLFSRYGMKSFLDHDVKYHDELCRRFFRQKEWDRDRAEDEVKARIESPDEQPFREQWRRVLEEPDDNDYGPEGIVGCMLEHDLPPGDHEVPGFGWPSGAAGWLCAVQERFAALYAEREMLAAADGGAQ